VNPLIDLYNTTPQAVFFLALVWYIVSLYIMFQLIISYVSKSFEMAAEEMRVRFVGRIKELEDELHGKEHDEQRPQSHQRKVPWGL